MNSQCYRKLQRHLNRMPVGFPRTFSGVEMRILKRLFTPREAGVALLMQHELEPAEAIYRRTEDRNLAFTEVAATLQSMARKGAVINVCRDGREHYALVPFVVGMFEFQLDRLSPEMYRDTVSYFKQGYALEFLSTALPQTRVIPIRKSLRNGHKVATYDEIRALVERAGDRVGLAPCICRKGKDLTGQPCTRTDRREVCLVLRDLFEHGHRYGLAKPLTTGEALDLLARNEKEGLVLQPSNEQEPQFVCSCCQCCCGLLGVINALPAPVDFTASNYTAVVRTDACNGCGVCGKRCPISAVTLPGQTARVESKRCIGCGVCVSTCGPGAIQLVAKPESLCPPATTEALYATIGEGKQGLLGKVKTGVRILRPQAKKFIGEKKR